jgi:hypothetical protein
MTPSALLKTITLPALVPMASCWCFLLHMQKEAATVIPGQSRKGFEGGVSAGEP